jgi:AraC-like DNA-binding protein
MVTIHVNLLTNRLKGHPLSVDRLSTLLARFKPSAQVFFAGQCRDSLNFDTKRHLGHIHWLFDGQADLLVAGKPIEALDEPCIVFLAQPITHSLIPRPEAKMLCCEFEFGHREANPLVLIPDEVVIIKMREAEEFQALGHLIHEEFVNSRCGQQFGLTQLMQYFVLMLLRHLISTDQLSSGITKALADPRLLRAVTAMHDHPGRDWCVEHLASEAGMSRAAFFSHFKQATGQTPTDYLTDWRISISKSLLLNGEALKPIAHAVGYGSPAALIRVFKRKVGCSPSDWANKQSLNRQDGVNLLR